MKTLKDLETELRCKVALENERAISNTLYAPMLVKTIVYGMVSLILIGVVGALITLIIKK